MASSWHVAGVARHQVSAVSRCPQWTLWTLRHQGPINYAFTLELETNLRENFTITEKAPPRAFSWLKALITTFTFKCKTLLRHYARHYARQAHKHGK